MLRKIYDDLDSLISFSKSKNENENFSPLPNLQTSMAKHTLKAKDYYTIPYHKS